MPALKEVRRSITDRKSSMVKTRGVRRRDQLPTCTFSLDIPTHVFSALAGRRRPGSPLITPSRQNQTRNHLPSESSAKLALARRVVGRTRNIAKLATARVEDRITEI